MTDARAISGTYADLKFIKTRSVAQIVMEIPIETADAFLKMFGAPQPGKEIPVAIARLNEPPTNITAVTTAIAQQPALNYTKTENSSKSKRDFRSLPLSQQCALRCNDLQFHDFMGTPDAGEEYVTTLVKQRLGVTSRSELSTNRDAANIWRALESEYQNYITDKNYGGMAR